MLHDEQGVYNNLLRELQLEGSLRNYLRMTKEQLYDLVERITPVLQHTNTNFGAAITPAERLAVTLGYLATGMGRLFRSGNAVIISVVQGRIDVDITVYCVGIMQPDENWVATEAHSVQLS